MTHSHTRGTVVSQSRGFTLIELLVVIAIIGLLASVILASLNTARAKGRDARRIADIKSVQLANELYYDASSSYPLYGTAVADWTNISAQLTPTYISTMPKDPSITGNYKYGSLKSDNSLCTATPCPNYLMTATLENNIPSGSLSTGTYGGVSSCGTSNLYCVHN